MTDSVSKIHYSPLAEAKYVFLIEPREGYEHKEGDLLEWSCQLNFPAADSKGLKLKQLIEDTMVACHGTRKSVAERGMPIGIDKKDSTILVAKFKAKQLQNRDGSFASGPRIMDSKKQPWDGSAIGNGSKLMIAFKMYPWERKEGVGITLIPTAVQVVHFVPYLVDDGSDGFEEQAGGYAVASHAAEFDEFDGEQF